MTFLDQHGFRGTIDAVLVPADSRTNRNRGYAFVSFLGAAALERSLTALVGLKFEGTESKKTTDVSIAHNQAMHGAVRMKK
mmetsp:Transcript_14893/g.33114  ORF Transcript_14893/g.33114 Transcript_14893/m.33114 type:complete len:81 (+) Transcript_14893:3-245(+)